MEAAVFSRKTLGFPVARFPVTLSGTLAPHSKSRFPAPFRHIPTPAFRHLSSTLQLKTAFSDTFPRLSKPHFLTPFLHNPSLVFRYPSAPKFRIPAPVRSPNHAFRHHSLTRPRYPTPSLHNPNIAFRQLSSTLQRSLSGTFPPHPKPRFPTPFIHTLP